MIISKFFLAITVLVLFFEVNAQNEVSLDSTFGVNGKVRTLIQPEGQIYNRMFTIRQNDGKIIGASTFAGYPVLVRYLQDGDLDSTWGQNGIVKTVDSIDANFVNRLIELDNGQIIITGQKPFNNSGSGELVNYITQVSHLIHFSYRIDT